MMMYMLLPCSLCASLLRPTRFHIIIWVYIPREQNPHQHPQAQWLQACRTVGCAIAEFKQDEATRVRCPIRGDGRITAQGEAKVALPPNGLCFPG